MIRRDILPASSRYSSQLAETIVQKNKVSSELPSYYEKSVLSQISQLTSDLYDNSEKLAALLDDEHKPQQFLAEAFYYRDEIIPLMKKLRSDADQLETLTERSYWPIPVYEDLLFSIS
jgi:glutamine synthetase